MSDELKDVVEQIWEATKITGEDREQRFKAIVEMHLKMLLQAREQKR